MAKRFPMVAACVLVASGALGGVAPALAGAGSKHQVICALDAVASQQGVSAALLLAAGLTCGYSVKLWVLVAAGMAPALLSGDVAESLCAMVTV